MERAFTPIALIGIVSLGLQGTASSQNAVVDDSLQEIVVTAQRRSENLQDVPLAVSVVSGKDLEQTNFRGVTDLQYVVPSLTFDPNNGGGFQIRGVGTQSFDFSNEQGVSVVVDDVVMDAQRQVGLYGLNDIAQVEVLRGPQGTLFGKNATAGVISITTSRPVLNQFSAQASASYGERNDRNVYGTLNVPMGDMLALRVSAFEQGQDGFGRFTVLDEDLGVFRESGVRAKLLFAPGNNLNVMLLADYAHHTDNGVGTLLSAPPAIAAISSAYGATPGTTNLNSAEPYSGANVVQDAGAALHIDYTFANQTLTSVTAFRYVGDDGVGPADFVPAPLFVPINVQNEHTHKFSQEIRLASPTGQFFEYVAGLFYNDLKLHSVNTQIGPVGAPLPPKVWLALSGSPLGPPGNNSQEFFNGNRGEAAFGQVKLNLNERLGVIVGGRLTHDDNQASTDNTLVPGLTPVGYITIPIAARPVPPSGRATNTNLSYRVSAQYRIVPATMAYATYSTGYKGPGVAFVNGVNDPYRQETVKSYEVGLKSELFDGHLRVNADIFLEKYKNFQAQVSQIINDLPNFVIGNAGGLTSKGVETDVKYRPLQSLTLSGSVTYDEAYFTNYIDGPNNYSGDDLTNAPRWTFALGGQYTQGLGADYEATASTNYSWRGPSYANIGQLDASHLGGFGILNGRIALGPRQGHWHAGVYGRNLLDRFVRTGYAAIPAVGTIQILTANVRRTVGGYFDVSF